MREILDPRTDPRQTRRAFLATGGKAVIAGAALLAGCGKDEAGAADGTTLEPDTTGGAALDVPASDDVAGISPEPDAAADTGEDLSGYPQTTKGPWVQILAAGAARLRFETEGEAAVPVRLTRGGSTTSVTSEPVAADVTFQWPKLAGLIEKTPHPDRAGRFSMHDVLIEDLSPGEEVAWSVPSPEGRREGVFRAPPASGSACTVAWFSDTMMPNVDRTSALLGTLDPDVVLHGGDIQYMTNPLDTWSGQFASFSAFTKRAPLHFCVGNHESETDTELVEQYHRLIGAQGEPGGSIEYHAFSYGQLRVLVLNSESDHDDPESAQHQWMLAQLDAVPEGMIPVVCFHRPFFTFGNARPRFATRDVLHPIFVQKGVKLVLTGHNHSYERFEVDGITYVVDGGGGALLYDPDDTKDDVLAERPGDEALRKVASRSFGVLLLRLQDGGGLKAERHAVEEGIIDTFEIGTA